MTPVVSILIPYHNEGDLLTRSVESVLSQELSGPFEVIVVDDCSSVPPPRSITEQRGVRLVRSETPLHAAGARNLGVQQALAPLIAFLDADDAYLPGRLQSHVDALTKHTDWVFVAGDWVVERDGDSVSQQPPVLKSDPVGSADNSPRLISSSSAQHDICLEYPFWTGVVTIRKESFCRVAGFNENYTWGEEWDLFVRLAQIGPIGYVNHLGAAYLCRESSICSTLSAAKFVSGAEMFTRWRKEITTLPSGHRRCLRQQAARYWLLASQTYLEHESRPGKAVRCAWKSMLSHPKKWGLRSLIRSAFKCALP